MSVLSVTLDNIQLQALEIPQRFGPLGGRQALAVHEFPGGIRTIQKFGAFPGPVRWRGILTGANAFDREQQLDRKRVTGDSVILRYGRFAWRGVLSEFLPEPGHQYLIPYFARFEPEQDLSGVASVAGGGVTAEQQMAQQQAELAAAANPNLQIWPLPPALSYPLATVLQDLTGGLLGAGGVIASMSASAIGQIAIDTAVMVGAAAPLIAEQDATQASPAIDTTAYATAASNIAQNPQQPQATVQAINPDMFQLAQQYLGDASLWQEITNYNQLPPDPQPQGSFTLKIPPQ